MAIAAASPGYNDLGPLLFFPETDVIHNYLHIVQK